MADPITREQVERAIARIRADHDQNGIEVAECIGGMRGKPYWPGDVYDAWENAPCWAPIIDALERWLSTFPEPIAAPKPAEDSPERLRERREGLGWNQTWAAEGWRCVASCEDGSASAIDRARYAAALSAAEAERARPAIDPLAYTDSPAWDEPPVRRPAPEVVDVPQPIVKRCACSDIHDDVEAEWRPGEPYLTVTHTTVPLALLRAMIEAIDAQQGGVR